ncbi:MAG: transporter substrate-binding domain-containing protein [Rhodopila sp.]
MTQPLQPGRRGILAGGAALLGATALPRFAAAQTVDSVRAKGKVVIGIQGDNPPWGFINAKGEQQGLDADIGRLFGQEIGVPVEFFPTAVANRIPALVTGRVDILFATMGMYPDRAKAVQFSRPYAANMIVLVARKDMVVKSAADMTNHTIGVPRSSAQDTQVTKAAPPSATIRQFDDDAATIQALLSGQVDMVGANQFYEQRLNQSQPGVFERKFAFMVQYNGAATRLGEKAWNATVNAFIDKIKVNGQLAEIYRTWMGLPLPEFPESLEGIPFTAS